MLGSFPNIWPNAVTPTRCAQPPSLCHSIRSPRGSAPHVLRLRTKEEKQEVGVF